MQSLKVKIVQRLDWFIGYWLLGNEWGSNRTSSAWCYTLLLAKIIFLGYWLNIRGSYSHKVKLGWVHLIFIGLSWSFGLLIIPSFRLWGNFSTFRLLGVAVSKWLEKMGLNPGEIESCSSKRGFGVRRVWVSEVLLTGYSPCKSNELVK